MRQGLALVVFYLNVDRDTLDPTNSFTRDVRKVGHFGTGDLEVTVISKSNSDKAKPLIEQSNESAYFFQHSPRRKRNGCVQVGLWAVVASHGSPRELSAMLWGCIRLPR
ncbi:hypothetical protein OAN307_c10960 [Octadecabacter antarcticus 307]|uniref:Uncharacterized protein n=1 Tax=Octadecabacter antarcticus 307 TaxID=391626 RepID=M9R8Z5_9RHOB|nr:hypothetical protein OAN307_c10960 [Octadecabacter antarcticus 307]